MVCAAWVQTLRQTARRDEFAKIESADPLRAPGRILLRVVVIRDEREAVEIIRRDTTSAREWSRMKRRAGL